jgi:pimeloyl-ACP methyl ester carboxylesterase
MEQRNVVANGISISYLEAGPADGPLAVCLHGFPDTAYTWRHLLPGLAAAGYHAVAPWLRGYAPTEAPSDGQYQIGALVTDACALHEALGGGADAVLVGHDWGALIAYGAAQHRSDLWSKVVTVAVPPVAATARTLFTYDQLKRSFYMFLFQSPLAEAAVSLDDHVFLDRLWADWSPGYDAGWDLAQVKQSIGAPENLSAAIGYYRSMFDASGHDPRYAEAQHASALVPPQPTLYIHGDSDGCIGIEAADDLLSFLSPGSVQHTVENAGHFVQLDQPEVVNGHVLAFLSP